MTSGREIASGEESAFVAKVAALVDALRSLAGELPDDASRSLSNVVDAFEAGVEPLLEFPNAIVNPPVP